MKKIIPLNVDKDGCARCLTAGMFKFGFTNLMQIGWSGTTSTIIAEINESYFSCAIRNRSNGTDNEPRLEIGEEDVANALTSFDKDSMILITN